MYHQVLDDVGSRREYLQQGLFVSQKIFDKQISHLTNKYRPITLARMAGSLQKNEFLDRRSVVITFDDGWRDNYLQAFPMLKKHRAPAIIFLTTDYIGTSNIFWFLQISILMTYNKMSRGQLDELIAQITGDAASAKAISGAKQQEIDSLKSDTDWFIENLKQLDTPVIFKIIQRLSEKIGMVGDTAGETRWMLNWEEVAEMSQNGIDFGSHGCSHKIMTTLDGVDIDRELKESKRILEEKLRKEINIFSYPNGDFSDEIQGRVRQCGYICAVATRGRSGSRPQLDLYALKRIGIHEGISVGPHGRFSRAMFDFHLIRNS